MNIYRSFFENWLIFTLTVMGSLWSGQSNQRLQSIDEALRSHNVELTKLGLIAALRNPDSEVRGLAAQKLSADGASDAAPDIAEALKHEPDPTARLNMGFALAKLGNPLGLSTLKDGCSTGSEMLRLIAARYLLNLGHDDCLDSALNLAAKATEPDIQAGALALLPEFKSASLQQRRRMVDAAKDSLRSSEPPVRIQASNTLGKMGDPSAVQALKAAIAAEQDDAVKRQMQSDLRRLASATQKD